MPRRLLTPLVFGFFLGVGTFASACPTCDLPPAASPIVNPAPENVFEAAAPGALLAGEQDWLLAREGGRYELINGRLSDRKAADPERHLLTNSAAWALLGRRTAERISALRSLVKDGRLPEDSRQEAVALFWTRGTLVSSVDSAFLREITRPKAPSAPNTAGLDERGGKLGGASLASGGVAAAATAAQDAELLKTLLASLELRPDVDPRAAPALNAALSDLVKTPTGREVAQQFLASGAKAKVEFGDVVNSTTAIVNGRRILIASGGNTDTKKHPPVVLLNRHFLDTDPDYRRVKLPAILAHELFGHALEQQRAEKAGVSFYALNHYRGDEANSGLIEWLLQTELGGPLDNGHMWSYLADPERYHADLKTNMPYYSTTLSTVEMRSPVAALEGRVAGIKAESVRARTIVAGMTIWRPVIEHFITVHNMERSRFSSVVEKIDAGVRWGDLHEKTLNDINAHLTATIAEWKGPASDMLKEDFLTAAYSPYMRESEQRLAVRAARLRGLVAGRKQEPSAPPIPGKILWEDLQRMLEQDRKDNPGHWEKTK